MNSLSTGWAVRCRCSSCSEVQAGGDSQAGHGLNEARRQNYPEAIGTYRRPKPLVAAQPDNDELAYLLARAYVRSGQFDAAKELFRSMPARSPEPGQVHVLVGEGLNGSHETERAIGEFEIAAKSPPTLLDVDFGLGYLYWKRKRYVDAEREFRAEIHNDPNHARSFADLGDTPIKTAREDDEALIEVK